MAHPLLDQFESIDLGQSVSIHTRLKVFCYVIRSNICLSFHITREQTIRACMQNFRNKRM